MRPVELTDRPVQPQGSAWARRVLGWFGWQLQFDGLPARQGVLVFYPHTSNWDFPLAMLAMWGTGMPVRFWIKSSMLGVPLFGRWLRWIGAVGIDRKAPAGVVAATAGHIAQAQQGNSGFWLALAPEGTRALGRGWRSGFYRVATAAAVPLALGFIDFSRRRLGVLSFLQLCGDADADMAEIARRYDGVRGRRHALAAPIVLS